MHSKRFFHFIHFCYVKIQSLKPRLVPDCDPGCGGGCEGRGHTYIRGPASVHPKDMQHPAGKDQTHRRRAVIDQSTS